MNAKIGPIQSCNAIMESRPKKCPNANTPASRITFPKWRIDAAISAETTFFLVGIQGVRKQRMRNIATKPNEEQLSVINPPTYPPPVVGIQTIEP